MDSPAEARASEAADAETPVLTHTTPVRSEMDSVEHFARARRYMCIDRLSLGTYWQNRVLNGSDRPKTQRETTPTSSPGWIHETEPSTPACLTFWGHVLGARSMMKEGMREVCAGQLDSLEAAVRVEARSFQQRLAESGEGEQQGDQEGEQGQAGPSSAAATSASLQTLSRALADSVRQHTAQLERKLETMLDHVSEILQEELSREQERASLRNHLSCHAEEAEGGCRLGLMGPPPPPPPPARRPDADAAQAGRARGGAAQGGGGHEQARGRRQERARADAADHARHQGAAAGPAAAPAARGAKATPHPT
jgi:hypothetical protein